MAGDSVTAAHGLGSDLTVDAFLGGQVEALQRRRGHHRAGLEAVLLGAAFDSDTGGRAVDLGAGVGVAGFCLAARCPAMRVRLVERDPVALDCARAALARPANAAFALRVAVLEVDIAVPEAHRVAAGLGIGVADIAILNPPFYSPDGASSSPRPARAGAHMLADGGLTTWFRVAASVLKPGGTMVAIFRADGLDLLLDAIGQRFGALDLLPIHPRADQPAHRILVRGVKGSRSSLSLLPGLVLHGAEGGGFLAPVERILRDGAGLGEASPAWQSRRAAPS